jgi:hypothetical protein
VSPIDFFRRELAPTRRRFVEAARNATKTAITTGLAATMQILGPLGPLFAFRIGQPGISLGLFEGVVTIVFAAAMQAAIVPITGKLLDYPGLIMAFLFPVFATMGYLLSNIRLFLILALVAVGTITSVYVGIFEPGQMGWGSTYTFDGILLATLVMVVLDTLIWPYPPEPKSPYTPEQNGLIERFFRSLKEECVWLHNFGSFTEARIAITKWIEWYNVARPHQSLGYRSPHQFRELQPQLVA